MDIEDLEQLKKEYKATIGGHRASLRKFVADTARWVKAVEEDEEVIEELYDHPFWGDETPPKALMQAAMAFLASCKEGKGFKLAQKRARVVEFLIHEGCELDDLEVALKEGLNKIYERAAKEDPRHSKKEREEQENVPEEDVLDDLDEVDDSNSKKKPKPPAKSVILIGKGVIKLRKYPDGKRLKLIVKLENADDGTIEVIKVIPLKG